jgi:esterase
METGFLDCGEVRLAYLRIGKRGGVPLLFLHGHYGRGRTFVPTLERLAAEGWDCIALDQRGHGRSDRATSYGRRDYVSDLRSALRRLGLERVIVVGHSLGGVNAYQLAAWHPTVVEALVVVDIGAVCDYFFSLDGSAGSFPSLAALRKSMSRQGLREDSYFLESVVETDSGWRLRCDPDDMTASQRELIGDHWDDWTEGAQPVLLVRGEKSDVLPVEHADEMVRARMGATLVEVPRAGHLLPFSHARPFGDAVADFLRQFN